jgi:hypothetical protein
MIGHVHRVAVLKLYSLKLAGARSLTKTRQGDPHKLQTKPSKTITTTTAARFAETISKPS